jgi:hypothetical protein
MSRGRPFLRGDTVVVEASSNAARRPQAACRSLNGGSRVKRHSRRVGKASVLSSNLRSRNPEVTLWRSEPIVLARRPVADPVARAGTETGSAVVGVRELTAVEREATTADALREAELEPLELGDPLVDPRPPCG